MVKLSTRWVMAYNSVSVLSKNWDRMFGLSNVQSAVWSTVLTTSNAGTAPQHFSVFRTLAGNDVNFDEHPVKIMSKPPSQHSLTFVVDPDINAAVALAFRTTVPVSVTQNAKDVFVSFKSAEYMSTFVSSPLVFNNKSIAFRRLVEFKSSYIILTLSGLEPAPFPAMAHAIEAALKPYGTIIDIVFSTINRVLVPEVRVLIDCANIGPLLGSIKIGTKLARIDIELPEKIWRY